MDKMSKEEVLHIANLANIIVSETELENYQVSLKEILNLIDNINDIEGYDDEIMISPCTNYATLRSDLEEAMLKQEEVMKNVPHKNGNFIETVGVMND